MDQFRFILERNDQSHILAGEEALLDSVSHGAKPVLRFVIFDPAAVLVGYHQSVEQEVNLDEIKKRGWSVGRRPTGGGTIVMGPWQMGWEIYSHSSLLGDTPENALRRSADAVIETLDRMGIKASFRPKNDVEVNGRKISGIGAFSEGKYIGVTGTILVDFNVDDMLAVMKMSSEKMKDKLYKDFRDRLTWVNRELGRNVEIGEVISQARSSFADVLGIKFVDEGYTSQEVEEIEKLNTKYSSSDWVFNIRKTMEGEGVKYLERKLPGGLVKIQVKMAGKGMIESVLITGDFFVEPRRAIYDLEARLKWSRAETIDDEIRDWGSSVKMIGMTPQDLLNLIKEVIKS
jgi:lipoate-protein ligase A